MNSKRVVILILALSLLAIGAKILVVKSVDGQSEYFMEGDLTYPAYTAKYMISTQEYTDGSISGYARESRRHKWQKWRDYNYKINVDCLNIFDTEAGRVAAVSGWTTSGDAYYVVTYMKHWNGNGFHGTNYGDWTTCMDVHSFHYDGPASVNIEILE